jgi:hypothetical protein
MIINAVSPLWTATVVAEVLDVPVFGTSGIGTGGATQFVSSP